MAVDQRPISELQIGSVIVFAGAAWPVTNILPGPHGWVTAIVTGALGEDVELSYPPTAKEYMEVPDPEADR